MANIIKENMVTDSTLKITRTTVKHSKNKNVFVSYNIPPPYLRIAKSLWAMGYKVF